MTLRYLIFALLVAVATIGTAAARSPIVGVASVIDGDTLEIHGQRIRLHGIDAPESGQFCEKDGKQYRCGQQAALALANKIGRLPIRCEPRDIDRYKRVVAICRLGEEDLNGWMVRHGWAIAYRQYSRDYVNDERVARTAKAGIWAERFIEPSKWRRGDRLQATEKPSATSCQIKGNISQKGKRIYHIPGGRYYEATRVDDSRGERWFCSEDEARKAGWPRSRQ